MSALGEDTSFRIERIVGNEIRHFSAPPARIGSALARTPSRKKVVAAPQPDAPPTLSTDETKRGFLRAAGIVGLGVAAASLIPRQAEAYVMGSAPTSGVVGVKNSSNTRIDPATEGTLAALLAGNAVLKKTAVLTSSGTVHTPASGKKIRVYNNKFSLTANMTSVSFRFGSGGTDFEIYLAPRTGGLYGTNNHPNYYEGGVDQPFYCNISGTGSVQINIDYLEV